MTITRGLIIDTPWIDHILEGRKDWEMRSQPTIVRGWVGLIRKGSGKVVAIARLADCGKALTPDEMVANEEHHRIPERMIRSGEVAKWCVPWKLADIRPLAREVPYEHKSGAVIWVTLSDDVSRTLATVDTKNPPVEPQKQSGPSRTVASLVPLAERPFREEATMSPRLTTRPLAELASGDRKVIMRKAITGGSLRNKYIRLGDCMDSLPEDVIGGGNKSEAASKELTVHWGGPNPARTDIAGDKKIFRDRSIMRNFIETAGACEGDVIVISLSDPYTVHLSLERSGST
ncbi:hypothetical protein [Donghicola sp. XS_ASV15]|uniref:hypothetical protein n=1 Tax=Donghicola sp. XS_ASV15 TaxID=3241295 RepID=UPI00351864B8